MNIKKEHQEILDKFEKRHLLDLFSGWVSMIGNQFFDNKYTSEDMVDHFIEEYIKPKMDELLSEE